MPSGKIPTSDWLRDKLDRLLEMTYIVKKVTPDLYSQPDPAYGFWSIKKEIALMYWAYPFQQIAKNHFKFFYYIDLFAGSGLMKAEDSFFVGSPIVAVASALKDHQFSQYICMEANEARKVALEKRTEAVCSHFGTYRAKVYQADCNLRNPECAPALSEFFGDDDWRDCDIEEAFYNYKFCISELRAFVDSLEVRDEQHHRLYDLVFATNSQGMRNALADLKMRLDKIQTKTIRGLYAVATEGQKQLTDNWSKT